ncbi:chromosome segregation in meiosis protein 3 [Coniochaeta sp. 2T2.1]|nr:chromosome segregation in meiosis protein 3 [Coniochaeta sp. 2T2.1]
MPSKTTSRPSAPPPSNDFDDYLLEGDLSDNPFASPPPGAAGDKNNANNKRKEPGGGGGGGGGLGIDEEVEVKKRVTLPRVKLDEARLLSPAGIPKLRSRAKHLRLRGKGHEWSDASKLLSFYQIWLDDLFPKAKFLDALAMVEKAGHKGGMVKARLAWIDEGKPGRGEVFDDNEDVFGGDGEGAGEGGKEKEPSRIAPIFEQAKKKDAAASGKSAENGRLATPDREDLFGDGDDIYNATPRQKTAAAAAQQTGGGVPDEDDLDALMAEAESGAPVVGSLFGGGGGGGGGGGKQPNRSLFGGSGVGPAKTVATADEPDDDDLDALMAEAEGTSIFGNGKAKVTSKVDEGDDDLDALMAEVEAGATSKPQPAKVDASKLPGEETGPKDSFQEDEEAMAEMDGLW